MTTETTASDTRFPAGDSVVALESTPVIHLLRRLLMPVASLKLTVALLLASIIIILVGTLAQVDRNMWEVIHDYFRSWIAWIDLQVFFPRPWFPRWQSIPGGFYFPGGALIGLLLFVNLAAAHLVRFASEARGPRLVAGLALTTAGVISACLVVVAGHASEGLQGLPLFRWSTLWLIVKVSLVIVWMATVYGLATLKRQRKVERWILAATTVGLGTLLAWIFYQREAATLSDSSMRILWQLIQGGLAASILLGGCVLLFKKRAGVVLLHGGVGLIMLSEWLVGQYAMEERITIAEGQTVDFARDLRSVELAVVDASDPQFDQVVAVPKSMLIEGERIHHKDLPFDVKIVRYLKNSHVRPAAEGQSNVATAGQGKRLVAEEVRPGSGTDTSGAIDEASIYATFIRKDSDQTIGTHLLTQCMFDDSGSPLPLGEKIKVDEKTYDVSLRFKRSYKTYSMHLVDVRKDDYLGTDTPMNYSSDIRLVDPQKGVDRRVRIWMNNPLRFAGETFYQSDYRPGMGGPEVSSLQVVTNAGWMIPYVGCMIVGTGMLFHFGNALLRFLKQRQTAATPRTSTSAPDGGGGKDRTTAARSGRARRPAIGAPSVASWLVPLLVVLPCAALLVSKARLPRPGPDQMDLQAFGTLPIVYQGRVKPLDTLARNGLRIISSHETFKDDSGRRQPAIRWLADVISNSPAAGRHKVFRITNPEVLDTLGLKQRQGFRYAWDELAEHLDEFEKQAEKARRINQEKLTFYQRKVLKLDRHFRTYLLIGYAFRPVPIPPFPTLDELKKDEQGTRQLLDRIKTQLSETVPQYEQFLARMRPPLAVPTTSDKQPWLSYATAWHQAYLPRVRQEQVNPATIAWNNMLSAYAQNDVARLNRQVASYEAALAKDRPTDFDPAKTRFEAFFNHFAPFFYCAWLYVLAFVLAALAWLGWSRPLNRSALWLIVLAFGIHAFALVGRIYISGRPPVTNLYTTAVFIGWGCVVLGMIIEWIYRLGIGNLIAAVAGSTTLGIAHLLAGDGDTFTVLQAVLDTQFWLATHVVTINLGYSATFAAGLLGMFYILFGFLTPALTPNTGKEISRMIYGTLCFAIFFSFIGTVLGGLWADDSWGRFWGWDPKENGALIIVLWNVLILHARWGGMVKDRGLAVLAVGGNIVTSWSWFGVNELNVGLHSYGFTEGVLPTLGIFVLSQLVIMVAGILPLRWWSSYRLQSKMGLAEQ